jgi:hypothetical protein
MVSRKGRGSRIERGGEIARGGARISSGTGCFLATYSPTPFPLAQLASGGGAVVPCTRARVRAVSAAAPARARRHRCRCRPLAHKTNCWQVLACAAKLGELNTVATCCVGYGPPDSSQHAANATSIVGDIRALGAKVMMVRFSEVPGSPFRQPDCRHLMAQGTCAARATTAAARRGRVGAHQPFKLPCAGRG